MRGLFRFFLACIFSSVIISCGGGGSDSTNTAPNQDRHFPFTSPANDESIAYESLPTHVQTTQLTSDDILEHPSFGEIVDNELIITFATTATIADIRTTLDELNADFKSTIEGSGVIAIILNERKTSDQLSQLIEQLEQKTYIDFVLPSLIAKTKALPSGSPLFENSGNESFIDHHLAVNAHGAWNVQSAKRSRYVPPVKVIVTDAFTGDHGYFVEGIISGGFSNITTDVQGMYPEGLSIDRVESFSVFDRGTNKFKWKLHESISILLKYILDDDYQRPIIVNASWGKDLFKTTPYEENKETANQSAINFLSMIRGKNNILIPGSGLENKFIVVAATGNIYHPDLESRTELDIPFGAVRMLDLTDIRNKNIPIPNATNVIVVENFMYGVSNEGHDNKPVVACMSDISFSPENKNKPGHIGAIGTNVYSYAIESAKFDTGTSFSTPQVSGLAASIWDISPTLLPSQVIDIMQNAGQVIGEETIGSLISGRLNGGEVKTYKYEDGSETGCKMEIGDYKVIDAYRSLLLLDNPHALVEGADVMEARVRIAALDGAVENVTNDMRFDENDIQEFISEYSIQDGRLDYSKYDLNGDGRTGGTETDKFDLNLNGTYEKDGILDSNTFTIFTEQSLTDLEILCYYAYSNLYEGNELQRDVLLLDSDCRNNDTEWFATGIEPLFINREIVNNELLNPPSAVSLDEGLILNTAIFTDHQNGDLKIQTIGPVTSKTNMLVGFDTPNQASQHARIQYCISPDTFIECWESVSGTATIEGIDGYMTIVFNNAQFEMYFDSNGDWLSIEAIRTNGSQIIDASRTQSQQFTGKARFLPAADVDEPTACDSIPTLLINPAVEASAIVSAEPPTTLPSAQNALACVDNIPNNTAIGFISGPYSDAVFGDVIPWHKVTVSNESSVCSGVTGYVAVSNISFSNQLCATGDALIKTPATGILAIMDAADLFNGQRACTSFSNASVILGAVSIDNTIPSLQWRSVEVLNGPCKGVSGYVDETLISVP